VPIIIYISGFRQHAGKTFTSLGIISRLLEIYNPEDIGYIKPVGQELFILEDGSKIDRDAMIIKDFILPTLNEKVVSPVRLGTGVTKSFLSSEDKKSKITEYHNSLDEAIKTLSSKKIIIAEGTGHPGVGGIINLSNCDVSKKLNADVIYLAGGGIGKTLDMLEVDLTYFKFKGVKVKGIIFNKLIPEKIDEMKKYITEDYITEKFSFDGSKINILGWMPEIIGLNKPSMRLIKESFLDAVIAGDPKEPEWSRPCTGVTIVSQSHRNFIPSENIDPGNIIILSSYSIRRLKKILHYNRTLSSDRKLSGIIFTCTKTGEDIRKSKRMVIENKVPAIYVLEDTSSADEKLYNCIKNTKLQSWDKEKNSLIINAFKNNFDLEKFKACFL